MATTNINISIQGLLGNPVVDGDQIPSLQRLIELFTKMKGGELVAAATAGTVTMQTNGSATFGTGTVTFAGAATAADTVTIAGTALTATKKNATGTVTFASALNNDTITVQGVVFTAKTSPSATDPLQFALGANDTAAAANFIAAVNAYPYLSTTYVTGTSASAVATLRAVNAGTGGNAITLASINNTRLAVSGATLSGGAAASNNAWDPGNTAATAAAALAAAVNASSTAAVSGNVVATVAAGVVTLKARTPGQGGNVTLAKSGSNITVSGAALTGGALGSTITFTF